MKTYQEKPGITRGIFRLAAVLFPENYLLSTSHEKVISPEIPAAFDGFRIVQVSDLHGCQFGKENRRLLDKIEAEKPDLLVLTGDIADRRTREYEPIFRFVEALCDQYPVVYISGNHEQEMPCSRRRMLQRGLCAQGVRILDNKAEKLERNGETVTLCGVRVPLRYYRWNRHGKRRPKFSVKDMEQLLGACGPEYTVLLAHNPLFFETYAAWGADLTFSGHVHGGMIRLPRFGGLLSPERSFFPRYSAGMYSIGKRCMAVSRGLGRGPRVNNPPEIVSLTLCRARPEGTAANSEKEDN